MGNITKLPVNCFKWIQETFQFNKDFIKSFDEESDEIFLLVDIQYPGELHELCIDLTFLPERIKIEKVEELGANLDDKKIICYSH